MKTKSKKNKEGTPEAYFINPISTEMAVMKSSHLAGLLQTLKRNLSRQNNRIRLFEIGNVFSGNIKNHNEVFFVE